MTMTKSKSTTRKGAPKLAGDLQAGDQIELPATGSTPVLVEQVEHITIADIDRVRVRLYGQTTGLRTTLMVNADVKLGGVVGPDPAPEGDQS